MWGNTSAPKAPPRGTPKNCEPQKDAAAEDLRRLLELQETVRFCYREINRIKKRHGVGSPTTDE